MYTCTCVSVCTRVSVYACMFLSVLACKFVRVYARVGVRLLILYESCVRARVCVCAHACVFRRPRRTDKRRWSTAAAASATITAVYRHRIYIYVRVYATAAAAAATTYAGAGGGGVMDPSVLSAMDRDALKKQIENMRYQSTMDRWPLSRSIQA